MRIVESSRECRARKGDGGEEGSGKGGVDSLRRAGDVMERAQDATTGKGARYDPQRVAAPRVGGGPWAPPAVVSSGRVCALTAPDGCRRAPRNIM